MSTKPVIFVAMPFFPGSVEEDTIIRILCTQSNDFSVKFMKVGGSNTAKAFNMLWNEALNNARAGEAHYFAMVHADIIPEPSFLQKLWDDLHGGGFDVVSAVSPIKNQYGLTSCGCDMAHGDPWKVRRFTMKEIIGLPETFTTEDTVAAGLNDNATPLLVNTGCWLGNLANPVWRMLKPGTREREFCFTFYDRIVEDDEGDGEVGGISEDWDFSRKMAKHAVRYAATRKVSLRHIGRWAYHNDSVWGQWEYDQAHPELVKHEDPVHN